MKRSIAIYTALLFLAAASAVAPAKAQASKQTISLMAIAPLSSATGSRSSKVVGSAVSNEDKEDIGKIDGLIITAKDSVPFATVSVGGLLGMGKHYLVVPAASIEVIDGRITLHGATKETLKALPDDSYTD